MQYADILAGRGIESSLQHATQGLEILADRCLITINMYDNAKHCRVRHETWFSSVHPSLTVILLSRLPNSLLEIAVEVGYFDLTTTWIVKAEWGF